MPLPKIAIPKYPIVIPSSKKETTFRPFLMKEQKILMIALEGKDNREIFSAMCDILKSCVEGIDDPISMPVFDIEYLFAKVRAKSVGELIEVKISCPKCSKKSDLSVNLEDLEVDFPKGISNRVMLNENLGIILRYPCLGDAMLDADNMSADKIVEFVCNSVDMVFDDTNTWTRKDFTKEEIVSFVESMNASQFEEVIKFYKNLPQVAKTAQCKCVACGNEFELDFRGLQDFFT